MVVESHTVEFVDWSIVSLKKAAVRSKKAPCLNALEKFLPWRKLQLYIDKTSQGYCLYSGGHQQFHYKSPSSWIKHLCIPLCLSFHLYWKKWAHRDVRESVKSEKKLERKDLKHLKSRSDLSIMQNWRR